jgi:UDPglucose--hexose-1-phosphate uridylyltransferase
VSELRQNVVTKEWVVIASERSKRPEEYGSTGGTLTEDRPERDDSCPFCPGNEDASLEVMRIPESGAWEVRVVRNKFPAVDPETKLEREVHEVVRRASGFGFHEVLVESPRHNTCAALETPEHVARVFEVFQERGRAFAADERIEHVIYFKNHGEKAGTSLVHPHTQIVALPLVPYDIRARTEEARRHFDDTGRCVMCEMLGDELRLGTRIVMETERFVALVPYAAASPFHLWVVPRAHEPDFLKAPREDLADLGGLMHRLLRKVYKSLRDPDYNYVIRSAPMQDVEQDYLHWYITIIPRLTRAAGFELGARSGAR